MVDCARSAIAGGGAGRLDATAKIKVDVLNSALERCCAQPEMGEIGANGLRCTLQIGVRGGEQSRVLHRFRAEFGIVNQMLLFDHAAQQSRRFDNCDLIVERQRVDRTLGRSISTGQFLVGGVEYDLGRGAIERRLKSEPDSRCQKRQGADGQDEFPPTPEEIQSLQQHLSRSGGLLPALDDQTLSRRDSLHGLEVQP